MANHSPDPNNYVISKTWDEAMNGEEAKGEAELPKLAEAVKQAEYNGEAAGNGGSKREAGQAVDAEAVERRRSTRKAEQ